MTRGERDLGAAGRCPTAPPLEDIVKLLGDPRPAVQRHAIEVSPGPRQAAASCRCCARSRHADAVAAICAAISSGRSPGSTIPPRGRWSMTSSAIPTRRSGRPRFTSTGLWRDKSRVRTDRAAASHRRLRTAAPRPRRWGESATSRPCRRSWRPPVETDDRILEHSLTYALIEIGDPEGDGGRPVERKPAYDQKAAMVALDQMDGGGLDPKFVAGLLAAGGARPQGDGVVDRRPASRVGPGAGRCAG